VETEQTELTVAAAVAAVAVAAEKITVTATALQVVAAEQEDAAEKRASAEWAAADLSVFTALNQQIYQS
jgi:hypothetical protein